MANVYIEARPCRPVEQFHSACCSNSTFMFSRSSVVRATTFGMTIGLGSSRDQFDLRDIATG